MSSLEGSLWKLLILALLSPSQPTDSFCQTQSGQVCRQNDKDPTIYQCDIEEPTRKKKVMAFNEGETIELFAVGDKSGFGCSIEIKDTAKDKTCCYIHEEREETRGEKLCGSVKQPDGCRQPGREEYKVEELDGPVGWCKLTIFEARLSDAGVYKITFPFEPARYNQEITVQVNQIGLNQAESLWMLVAMVLLVVLLVLLVANGVIYFLQNKSKKIQEDCRRCSLTSSKSAGCEEAGVEMFNSEEEKIESRWMGTRPRSWSRGG